MAAQLDLSTQIMDQLLRDQNTLAKQMDTTGKTVSNLAQQFSSSTQAPYGRQRVFPADSSSSGEPPANPSFPAAAHRHAVPKMSFPKFTGANPTIWRDKCLDYFHIFNIPETLWTPTAAMNMDDNAAKWLQVHKLKYGLGTWSEFIAAVDSHFGSYAYRDALNDLIALEQEDSLEEYIATFTDLQYQASMHNLGLDEIFFVTHFVKGLKLDIRVSVQSQAPETVKRAVMLAKIQQQLLDSKKLYKPKSFNGLKSQGTMSKSDSRSSSSSSSLWKERQLRDYRKANGLCMYCGDKFDKMHATTCTKRPQAQVHALAINDLDQALTEEVLTQLAVEDSLQEEFEQLSLNALAGTASGEVMRLRATVKNKVMLILLDSGSSHSFVNSSFLSIVGITPVPVSSKKVKLANGQILVSAAMAPDMEWWCQGHTFRTDLQVLELGAYDAILGYDWLKQHSPMTCQWEQHTVEFMEQGKLVTLKGVPPTPLTLSAVQADSFVKWHKGNDIWALAMVELETPAPSPPSPEIQSLLHEFDDVFAKPATLPPQRVYDHTIPLLPHTTPVNSRPYRYSPVHKDEIERQVKEMLTAGLITHSTSPFASPVLLVMKKDGTWRFVVDYRKLNDLTVKNRFPLPIIEEILDELHGAKYFTKLDMTAGYHQIRMLTEDEYKTAFKTHHGHFQFRVMPFGLTNAPATFQCLMNEVLQPFLRQFVLVFLDDILIYSSSMAEHLLHLREVLSQLRAHQFYLKHSKCSFSQTVRPEPTGLCTPHICEEDSGYPQGRKKPDSN